MTGPDPTARGDRAGRAGARLRLARLAAGLSQEQLAARAGVSRQAVAGIEAGRFDPSLRVALDLSRSLDRSVEDLFGPPAVLPAQPATLVASPRPAGSAGGDGRAGDGRAGGARVELARVGERAVAFSLFGDTAMRPGFLPALGRVAGPAEGGSAGGTPAGPGGEPVLVESGPSGQPALVVAGCDPALALLAGPLSALTPPRRLVWWPCNSATALDLAASGLVHAAGVHLPEGGPGIAAVAGPRLAATGAEVIGFGAWAEGLALHPGLRLGHGGPAGLLAGLAERGLRIVNREDGSEARQLLDDALAAAGVAPDAVAGYGSEVRAHLLVASAVAAGLGAAGVTMEPAARAHGLDFVALAAETFQLVVPRTTLHTAETQALLQILSAAALRLELGRLPGYDPTTCGEAVATIWLAGKRRSCWRNLPALAIEPATCWPARRPDQGACARPDLLRWLSAGPRLAPPDAAHYVNEPGDAGRTFTERTARAMLLLLATIPLMIIGVAIAVVPLVVTLVREPRADRPTPAQIDLAAAEVRTEDERLHDDLLRAATEAATRRDHHERVLVNA